MPSDKRMRPVRPPHGGIDRARITRTTFSLGDVDVVGGKPHCLVYVRTANARLRRDWSLCLRHTGVAIAETLPQGEMDEHGHYHTTAYRIVGTPQQLESTVCHACVVQYHYVSSARVPMGETYDEAGIPHTLRVCAQGGGAIKPKPAPSRQMQQVCDLDTKAIVDYDDPRKRKPKGTGSATEYESMQEAQIADKHTHYVPSQR